MIDVEVSKVAWERINRHHQAPPLEGASESVRLIDKDTKAVIAIQYLLGDQLTKERALLTRWLRFRLKWDDVNIGGGARLSGIKYPLRVFGFTDPKPLRSRWSCSSTLLTRDYPVIKNLLDKVTETNWQLVEQHMPEHAVQHDTTVRASILRDWLIADLPWTSGVINNTAALPYHKDSGNLAGTLSAMLCLRKGIDGGGLHLPEYNYTFAIPDGSVTIFDGQALWHSVTPFQQHKNGYRFTLVWYAKSGMCKCLAPADEILRAQRQATRGKP